MGGCITLHRLQRDKAGSGQWLDAVVERIRQASTRFGGNGEALVHQTWKAYADGTPYLGLWVAVDGATETIVGHALADIRNWDFHTVAWVTQVVMDTTAPPTLKTDFLLALDHWVKDVNRQATALNPQWKPVTKMLMLTGRDAKAWEKHAGFHVEHTLMSHEVRM